MTDQKKKREVRNHFGFALEDGKINRLSLNLVKDSFLLTTIQLKGFFNFPPTPVDKKTEMKD